jgi:peptidoglycan/xylan/chitin deacetylase (PgdA/CDA1 family)
VDNVLSGADNGSVVLLHDGLPGTLAAVPQIITALKNEGLAPGKIVPSSTPAPGFYDATNNTYDSTANVSVVPFS